MIAVVALRPGLKSVNNAVKFISVKYSAYGAGSYDSQSQYFPYVDILNLTVEKIPYNREAATAEVVGSNPTRSISYYEGTTVLN
jgi:hypothetical protein